MNGVSGVGYALRTSGRWSGRVAMEHHQPTEDWETGSISAPESFTRFTGAAPAAERGGAPRAERRMSRAQADRLAASLSDRDWAILHSVAAHRFLTTRQIERLHFADSQHSSSTAAARICRRVLKRLHELRVIEHLERHVGGIRAGSSSYVWRVGLAGDRLLRRQADDDPPRARRKEPSPRHLDHCLAVAEVHLMLRDLAASGTTELITLQTEPACWRRAGTAGPSNSVLKPDLYAVTAADDYEDHWFCEIDRATESLPTLLGKCAQYEAYRRSGAEQDRLGVFPRVVWVVPDQGRVGKLQAAITASRSLDADLFRICTPSGLPGVIAEGAA